MGISFSLKFSYDCRGPGFNITGFSHTDGLARAMKD